MYKTGCTNGHLLMTSRRSYSTTPRDSLHAPEVAEPDALGRTFPTTKQCRPTVVDGHSSEHHHPRVRPRRPTHTSRRTNGGWSRDCGPLDDAIQEGIIKIRKSENGSEEIPYCEQSLIDSRGVSAVKGVRLGPLCDKDEGLIRDFLMARGVPNPDVEQVKGSHCS